jgi:hypothetical protein
LTFSVDKQRFGQFLFSSHFTESTKIIADFQFCSTAALLLKYEGNQLSGTLVHFWQVFLSDKNPNSILLTNAWIQSMIVMVYAHRRSTDGNAQNINVKVHAPRTACRSLFKIVFVTANRNINWNCSTVFRKVIHYEILQKIPIIFSRIVIYIKQTNKQTNGRMDGRIERF